MRAIKRIFIGAIMGVSAFFGYQTSQPPKIETNPDQVIILPQPEPPKANGPQVNLGKISGASTEEEKIIKDGFALANKVLKSECTKAAFLTSNFTETQGMTQGKAWDFIESHQVTVDVVMYTGNWYNNHVSKTVGYELEAGTVYMNRYFVTTKEDVASNTLHEAMHSLGFTHFKAKPTSVPYGMNDIFTACNK